MFHGLLTLSLQAAVRNMVSQQTLILGIWQLLTSIRLSSSVGPSVRPIIFVGKCSRAYAAAVRFSFVASLRTSAIPSPLDTRSCSWCSGWNWRLAVQCVILCEEILHTDGLLSPHRQILCGRLFSSFHASRLSMQGLGQAHIRSDAL